MLLENLTDLTISREKPVKGVKLIPSLTWNGLLPIMFGKD